MASIEGSGVPRWRVTSSSPQTAWSASASPSTVGRMSNRCVRSGKVIEPVGRPARRDQTRSPSTERSVGARRACSATLAEAPWSGWIHASMVRTPRSRSQVTSASAASVA